jgi:hypothetical protein
MKKVKFHERVRYLYSPLMEQSISIEIDTESILSHEAVIEHQDYICGEIGVPTTIIQFRRDENDSWERIDSRISAISLRTSCDLLRRCINNEGKLCKECDAMHAELFYEINKDQITIGVLDKQIKDKKEIWEKMALRRFWLINFASKIALPS